MSEAEEGRGVGLDGQGVPLTCPHCRAPAKSRGLARSGDRNRLRVSCISSECRAANGGKERWSFVTLVENRPPTFPWTAKKLRELKVAKRIIFTSVQNNAPLSRAWQSVRNYAKRKRAVIVAVPIMYRNPTSPLEADRARAKAWFPKDVLPHILDQRVQLHRNLILMADIPIQATAVHPLGGLDPLSRDCSAIFGHGQVQMKTVATPQNKMAKVLHTTGTVSKKSYSKSPTGKKGEFHHTPAALIVEKEGPHFFMRGVTADKSGGFWDLDRYYAPDGTMKKLDRAEALVVGDEHVIFNDPLNRRAVYDGPDSLVKLLRPKKIVRHDVFDGWSISHWHRKNPIVRFVKWKTGTDRVEDELLQCVQHIDETTPPNTENVVVASNHHDHLNRWLKESDPRHEPWNAIVYYELMAAALRGAEMTDIGVEEIDPFAWWVGPKLKSRTRFLRRQDSEVIAGVEVSLHGDEGSGGTWGSIANLSRIGVRTVIAHAHAPGILLGAHQVGTSTKTRLHYTRGPDRNIQAHCAIYPNGKKQLIMVIFGHYRRLRD